MLLDLSPLRRADFRRLFIGQLVSFLGSMVTYVAVPYQVYALTGSNLLVGLLGTLQLVPLLLTALWGGAVADAMDRRRLLLGCEAALALAALALAVNAHLPRPSVTLVLALSALMSGLNGFHRPALEALTPRLVSVDQLASVGALSSVRHNVGAILGPALGGVLIARWGLTATYVVDVLSFVVSLVALAGLAPMPPEPGASAPGLGSILEGLHYARRRPELVGSYLVDVVAMTFAMPMALFPALAAPWGGPEAVGLLYAAPSVGSLVMGLFSGWAGRVRRQGAAVILGAAAWGLAILGLGFTRQLPLALLMLGLAGAADMVSGLFRSALWNETIPSAMRGRMAGVEMLSYMSGPLLGNARAGAMASLTSVPASIAWGGALCVAGVLGCIRAFPAFWDYERPTATPRLATPDLEAT